MSIKIYTTPSCPWCHRVKEYFSNKKLDFVDIDVSENQDKAEEMFKLSGQMGVPVIKIDDKIIIGFDPEEIEEALKKS